MGRVVEPCRDMGLSLQLKVAAKKNTHRDTKKLQIPAYDHNIHMDIDDLNHQPSIIIIISIYIINIITIVLRS